MENTKKEMVHTNENTMKFEITVPKVNADSFKGRVKKFLKIAVPVACVVGGICTALAVRATFVAVDHANIPMAQAKISDIDFDFDIFFPHFDVEWKYQGMEYEYKVHALTGQVLEVKMD